MQGKIDSYYSIQTLSQWGLLSNNPKIATSFLTTPSDSIDFNKLIDNKAFYIHKTIQSQHQRKRIIFAEWALSGLSRDAHASELTVYDNLIQSGFVFYVLTPSGLVEVNSLSMLQIFFKRLDVPSPQRIDEILAQHHWVRDEVFVLTADFLYEIEEKNPLYLKINEQINAPTLAYLKTLTRLNLQFAKHPSLEFLNGIKEICVNAEALNLYKEYEDYYYIDEYDYKDFISYFSTLKKLNLAPSLGLREDFIGREFINIDLLPILHSLEEISINTTNDSDKEELLNKLSLFPNIKTIILHAYSGWEKNFALFKCLPTLEKLTLHTTNDYREITDITQFSFIISQCLNLKYLAIYDLMGDSGQHFLLHDLHTLSELCLFDICPELDLSSLLSKCTHLKKFRIKDNASSYGLEDYFDPLPNPDEIEEIELIDLSYNATEISNLFKKFSNLKIITMDGCSYTGDNSEFTIPILYKLEQFISSHSSSFDESLILQKSPNLQRIDIDTKRLSSGLKKENTINAPMKHVNTITFQGLKNQELETVLSLCSKIRFLNLKESDIVGFENVDKNWDCLERIYLNGCKLSRKALESLLSHSPNLKELQLLRSTFDSFFCETYSTKDYVYIVKLRIEFTNIDSTQLGVLLSICPNLIELELINCYNLGGAFDLKQNLNQLKILHLFHCNLDNKSLKTLVSKAPNVVDLEIRGSTDSDIEEVPNNHLEKFFYHTNKSTLSLRLNNTTIKEIGIYAPNIQMDFAYLFSLLVPYPHIEKFSLIGSYINSSSNLLVKTSALNTLRILNFAGTSIEGQQLPLLIAKCPRLEEIFLEDTDIEPQVIAYIQKRYPDLILHVTENKSNSDFEEINQEKGADNSLTIDTDTIENPNKRMKAKEYIKNVPVAEYRISAYVFDSNTQRLVKIEPSNPLIPIILDKHPKQGEYSGVYSMELVGTKKAYPLPGKSPYDVIRTLQISNTNQEAVSDTQYSIGKCSNTGLYYLTFNTPHDAVYVHYTFDSTIYSIIPNEEVGITNAIRYFLSFGSGALHISHEASEAQIMDQMLQQKVGACRHKSMLFARLFQNYTCFVQHNEVHDFIEILINQTWYTIDLGGFQAQLDVEASPALPPLLDNAKTTKPIKAPVTPLRRIEKHFKSMPECLELLNACQKPALVLTSLTDKKKWIHDLQIQLKNDVFIVKPEEIHLRSNRVINGVIQSVDSDLVLFLNDCEQGKRFLILDFSDYKPFYISFYTALADERKINQTLLPETVQAVILLPSAFYPEMRGDFRSRFSGATLRADAYLCTQSLPSNTMEIESLMPCFDLYGNENFENCLVGTYKMDKNGHLSAIPGALLNALQEGHAGLRLNHHPKTEAFKQWLNTVQTRRIVYFNGEHVIIPEGFILALDDNDYELAAFTYVVTTDDTQIPSLPVYDVNSLNLNLFFANTVFDDKDHLIENKGIIAQSDTSIHLRLTEKLPLQSLYHLLDVAQNHGVMLYFSGINAHVKALINETHNLNTTHEITPKTNFEFITTNDITFHLTQQVIDDSTVQIPINKNTSYEELMGSVIIETKDDSSFKCRLQTGLLAHALSENEQSVILFGEISNTLAIRLSCAWFDSNPYLWLNGQKMPIKGRLQVVTSPLEDNCLAFTSDHLSYSYDDFYTQLEQQFQLESNVLNTIKQTVNVLDQQGINFSYNRLKLLFKNAINLNNNPFKLVLRLETKAEELINYTKPHFNYQKTPYLNHENKRQDKLKRAFAIHRAVFMVGKTGAGKSHLIQQVLTQMYTVFILNEDKPQETLLNWVTQWSHLPKVLVVDEMNLLHKNIIMQLANLNDSVLINGKLYALGEEHLILFVGNPSTYRGRTQYQFFNEMYSMAFKPLNENDLFNLIVKPLFNNALDYSGAFWQDHKKELLVSEKTPRDIAEAAIRYLSYPDYFFNKESIDDNTLCITSNWQKILKEIQLDLNTRQYKLDNNLAVGKQGILLEGDSSLAKSTFVRALLKQNEIPFLDLTGKNIEDTEEGLKKAFHKGQVVLLDEINTIAPLFERLLNHLLSGTDLNKNPAKMPGFFIIGTLNPASHFSGRIPLSEALENRMIKYTIESYTKKQITSILRTMHYSIEQATRLAKQFIEGKKLDTTLTLRDVLLESQEASLGLKRTNEDISEQSSVSIKKSKNI